MDESSAQQRQDLRLAARDVGAQLAAVGDFFDVIDEVAIGWANANLYLSGPPARPPAVPASEGRPAAYTGPGQMPADSAGVVEPDFGAAQASQGPGIVELGLDGYSNDFRLKLQLIALNEMAGVVRDVLEWRVDDARDRRWSWQRIGDALEMSRQAAHQRWGQDDSAHGANQLPWQSEIDLDT